MSHAGGDADNRLDEPMLSALERGVDDDATGGSGAEVASPASSIGASLFSSTINLANTCMGTGVLALPAAFAVSGLLSGVIVCVSTSALMMLSLIMLDACATRSAVSIPTFHSVCDAALPGLGSWVDGALTINCFGSAALRPVSTRTVTHHTKY